MAVEKIKSLSRRDFLKIAWKSIQYGVPTIGLLHYGIGTEDFDPEKEADANWNLAFIERFTEKPRPPFITATKGHEEFLVHAINTNPIIKKVTVKGANFIVSSENELSFSEIINKHVSLASKTLEKEPSGQFDGLCQREKNINIISTALYAMAGIMGSYIGLEDLQKLGVDLSKIDQSDIDLYKNHSTWLNFPSLYPEKWPDDEKFDPLAYLYRYSGKDRAVHLIHHTFLTFHYLKFKFANLHDADRIPGAAIMATELFSEDPYEKVFVLSTLAGYSWEAIETFLGETGHPSGFLDKTVTKDLKANKTGALFGITLFKALHEHNFSLNEILPQIQI